MVDEKRSKYLERQCALPKHTPKQPNYQFSQSNYIDIARFEFNITEKKRSLFGRKNKNQKNSRNFFKPADNQEKEKLYLKSNEVQYKVNKQRRFPKLIQWKPRTQVVMQPVNAQEKQPQKEEIVPRLPAFTSIDHEGIPEVQTRSDSTSRPSAFATCQSMDKKSIKRNKNFTFNIGHNQGGYQQKQYLNHASPLPSPRVSTDLSRTSNFSSINNISSNEKQQSSQFNGSEEFLNYIDGKSPRKMSTRDKYFETDSESDFWSQDPAVQLKKQLISMLVSNPEIEKRIKDVVKTEGDVDLATTTTQLDVQVDKSGAYCINQYIMIKTLGKGAMGTVKLCYNTMDKKLYAVKMIDRKQLGQSRMGRVLKKDRKCRQLDKQQSNLLREIAVLKKLEHHNIVKLHEVIDPPNKSQPLMLVMEYLEEGPVVKQDPEKPGEFKKLQEDDAADYFRMMCTGLDYLHYNRIVHGDLKPDNLLLDKVGELKIADFGCSRIMAEDNNLDLNNKYGTPSFRAPEMQSGEHYDPFHADIWAMGVCLYAMVFGKLPFPGNSEKEVYHNIQNQELTFPEETQISNELKDLLTIILQKNPLERANLYDIMNHEWVTECGRIQLISLIQMTRPPSIVEVTQIETDLAIAESENRLIKMDFEERIFSDGEYLLRNGDTTNVLYFILSGAVEVRDPKWRSRECQVGRQSFKVERDSSAMFYQFVDEGEDESEEDGDIYLDSQKTKEVASRIQFNSTQQPKNDLFLEAKGPANIIGDISICYPIKPYPYNVLARGEVRVLELTSEKLQTALMSLYDQQNRKVLSIFTGQQQQQLQQLQQQQSFSSSVKKKRASFLSEPPSPYMSPRYGNAQNVSPLTSPRYGNTALYNRPGLSSKSMYDFGAVYLQNNYY